MPIIRSSAQKRQTLQEFYQHVRNHETMVECDGWPDNKELRKLYNKIKGRKKGDPKIYIMVGV